MRLDNAALREIAKRCRPKHQAAWFKEYLGIDIPCDRAGPILTQQTYDALLAKRPGVFPAIAPA